ncbi:MAG: noncanonical pyrimidine nucleotidase, YjjG family [Bacteroidetes bacterium]|nr:noncanonical pyrimidine nucleotidase, YjjG family [Bacteroidota bacterium]
MKNVKHIFFDLDHTLWDFEKNSTEAILELFHQHELHNHIESFDLFIADYQRINIEHWDKYNRGEIDKRTVRYGRFYELFAKYQLPDHIAFAEQFADQYILISPHKPHLFPGTHEVLQYLKPKYKLHLITNGFKEVLEIKISGTNLKPYFDLILSAEEVGVNKPNPLVFKTALEKTSALPHESLMVGDSYEADILGAKKAGMATLHFNPKREPKKPDTNEIFTLGELLHLL